MFAANGTRAGPSLGSARHHCQISTGDDLPKSVQAWLIGCLEDDTFKRAMGQRWCCSGEPAFRLLSKRMYASWSLSGSFRGVEQAGVLIVMVVHSKVKYSFQRHTSFDDAHYMCLMVYTAIRLCDLAPFRAGNTVGCWWVLCSGAECTPASKQDLLGQRWSTGHPNMLDSAECHAAKLLISPCDDCA